ncbi:MAG: HAMP domain-containing histidine kinase [Planctomycetes bacterium]|nr:HAMP domain-containing histidine kinase [Planctomycetota bacterium]
MRPAFRHLPTFLTFLVPLLLLAWVGQAELRRQGERAERALEEQALAFLRLADLRCTESLRGLCATLLDAVNLDRQSLPAQARTLQERESRILDLLIFDSAGGLTYPHLPPPEAGLLPFSSSPMPQLGQAEILGLAGDLTGARNLLEEAVRESDPAPRQRLQPEQRLRALFHLAGLLRRLGLKEEADVRYAQVMLFARALAGRSAQNLQAGIDPAAVELLAQVAMAEMDGRPLALLEVLRDIGDGRHADVADELLIAVADRLLSRVPLEAPEADEMRAARHAVRGLVQGRRFAREFLAFSGARLREQLLHSPRRDPVLLVHGSGPGASLVAVRACRPAERGEGEDKPGFVGIRLNIALAINALLDPLLTPERQGFVLTVADPDGVPILPVRPVEGASLPLQVPPLTTLAGLRLQAIPVDPEAYLRGQRATTRNRILLLLALSMLAVGSGFLLVRSVSREAELAQLKIDFVSRVSHDLKTPLALIKMYGETLDLGRAQTLEQSRRFGGIITREADRLSQMIHRVLDFSRKEAGTLTYSPRAVDLEDLVATVTDEYLPHLEERGAKVSVTLAAGLTSRVDPEALRNALVNLLENAVKYTPADASERRVDVVLRKDGTHAVLEVQDCGVGIPEHERARVLQGFYRASTAGEVRGVGLGLTLVRHFVEAHGGAIRILGRDGGGTIVRLTLPLMESETRSDEP